MRRQQNSKTKNTQRVYYMCKTEHALSNLEHGRIKIAEFADMNDPFEMLSADLRTPKDRALFNAIKDDIANTSGAICFSSTYSNPVLWSHYADKHRGICLGFDVPRDLLIPMKYDAKRLPDFLPALLRGDSSAQEKARQRLLSTKFRDWRYESELRVVEALGKRDPQGRCFANFSEKLILREVLLGARFDGDAAAVERMLVSMYPGVQLQQMRLAFKKYAIVPNLKVTASFRT